MTSGLETPDILVLGLVARQPKRNSAPVSMATLKLRECFFVSAKYSNIVPGMTWNISRPTSAQWVTGAAAVAAVLTSFRRFRRALLVQRGP
jgi:hypothetical protein